MRRRDAALRTAAVLAGAGLVETTLVRLGRTYGSTAAEREMRLPGDEIVPEPDVVTDHAITIDAPAQRVWPWLVQMGWHRGGWYTARWVDRAFFPANRASADSVVPELQDVAVGDFIPDGPPETGCGFVVEQLEPGRALVLHSTSHLPPGWQDRYGTTLDWSWTFALLPVEGDVEGDPGRTRFLFRSRWTTRPWWFRLGTLLTIVPADLIMSRDMLRGVKRRSES